MNIRYSKPGQFNIDFNASDLDKAKKSKGRYPIEFKIIDPDQPETQYPKKKIEDYKMYFA